MSEFRSSDLPAFQEWSQKFTPPMDSRDYVVHNVDVTAAVILSDLFYPELVIVRGCLLLADQYEHDNFTEWWTTLEGNTQDIERVVNHLHIWDLFTPAGPIEEQALELLAQRVAQAWQMHAERQFPDRTVTVTVTDDYGPTIVMFSARPSSGADH